jgi:hypothetical protein
MSSFFPGAVMMTFFARLGAPPSRPREEARHSRPRPPQLFHGRRPGLSRPTLILSPLIVRLVSSYRRAVEAAIGQSY